MIGSLSPREREVIELLARGYRYKETADAPEVRVPTGNTHIRQIYKKMHVQSRGQAVATYANLTGDSSVAPRIQRRGRRLSGVRGSAGSSRLDFSVHDLRVFPLTGIAASALRS